MSEQPPARKHHRSDDSLDEGPSKKPKNQASASGLQRGNQLQLSIVEGIRHLCAYQSDLLRGNVASEGSILAVLDAMRAEIIGGASSDKHSLRLILPDEVLVAIFEYLDRISLEKLEHACRRFRTIVDSKMTNVCYRVIDCINIRYTFQFDTTVTVTAWIGNREYGAPLLSSDVSEHGERRAIIASELDLDHVTDVLTNVCRNANVLIYKVSDMALSEASPDLRETWTKLVPATANHMTVSELVLDGCTVKVPRDSDATPDTIVIGMLERFRRVLEIRLSVRDVSCRRDVHWMFDFLDDNEDGGFTDRLLEFCAAREIDSVSLSNWDKGFSDEGVINFLLNSPSNRVLAFAEAYGVTARFYDALVKASTEFRTTHTAALYVDDCDANSLPRIHDADQEIVTGRGGMEYRFFRGRLPFSLTFGEASASYKRSATVVRDEDEGGDDEPAQDDVVDEPMRMRRERRRSV